MAVKVLILFKTKGRLEFLVFVIFRVPFLQLLELHLGILDLSFGLFVANLLWRRIGINGFAFVSYIGDVALFS